MHKSGIILAVLVMIAAATATYFTAKVIQVRNSWTAKAQNFKDNYGKVATDLDAAKKKFVEVRDNIETALREWGATFAVDTQIANPAEGRLQLDAGTNFGLKEKMVLHGFEQLPDGSSLYRGPFSVATAQADRSVVVPAWRLRAGDVTGGQAAPGWQSGRWRWRSTIPSGYTTQFDGQVLSFLKADETVLDRTNSLKIQQRLVADTQRQVDFRTAELLGGDGLPQDESLKPEFRIGLVTPLEETEEARNKALLEIAQLREQVRAERAAVERLQAGNVELVQQLPQPGTMLTERDTTPAK